jgi:hypothetical protein
MIFFGVTAFGQAESESTSSFSYGVKAGLVSSTFASEYQKLSNTESRTAFSAGLFGEYQFTDFFGVSVEALYAQEGMMRADPRYLYYYTAYWSDNMLLSKVNSNVIMHNIVAPLTLNAYLPEMSGMRAKLYAGGSFDYMHKVYARDLLSVTSDELSLVLPDRSTEDVTESFEYYNISALAGAEFKYDMFSVDVRYKVGFMPVSNLATFNYENTYRQDFSVNTLFVSLGLYINELF